MVLLGENLKALIKSKGLDLKQTGELLGVAVSTVSSYERDMRRPSHEILFRYAEVFSASLDFIFGIDKRRNDNFSRLSYEHRKLIDEIIEFLLSKQEAHNKCGK